MKSRTPLLIGLAGRAGVGKSTVAARLCGVRFPGSGISFIQRLRFADPLKAAMVAMGLTQEEVDGIGYDREQPHPLLCGKSVRYGLQTLGTEWGRDLIGEDLWVSLAMRRADRLMAGEETGEQTGVVFDDLRFPNEAQAVIDRGGIIIRLVGRDPRTAATHASEQSLPPELITAEVWNDYTPLDTAIKVMEHWQWHAEARS